MRNLLFITVLFIASHCAFAQANMLFAPESETKNSMEQIRNTRGNPIQQFEFDIAHLNPAGTVALASDGEFFYIARYNNNQFTKLNLDGTSAGSNFTISGVNGLTTLAYDGRYFWGSLQTTSIHKIDMQANPPARVGSINSPVAVTHCTFDPTADDGNGGLWVGSWDTDIVLLSLTGTQIKRITAANHGLSGTIATAFDGVSPLGGPYLWTINSDGNPPTIRQLHVESGKQTGHAHDLQKLGHTTASSGGGGMFIMDDIVPGTTSLVVLMQNNNVVGFDMSSLDVKPIDVGISTLNMPGFFPSSGNYTISGRVQNYGLEEINSFKVSYQINNGEIHTYDVSGINLASFTSMAFTHPVTVEPVIGGHTIKVWTSLPNGVDDQNTDNDMIEHSYIVYDSTIAKERTILLEGFTSSSCGPCSAGNVNFKNVLLQNQGLFALIKYQMNWPGNGDPYYTAEGGVRRDYYGVNSVPWVQLEGMMNLNSGSVNNSHLTNLQAVPAFMDIEVDYYVEGQTVYTKAKIDPTIDFTGQNLRLYMAIVERMTYDNWITVPNQSNGEREFAQVMKKFLPDANGIAIGDLEANVPFITLQEWEFKGDYRRPNNANTPINHNIEHSVEDFENLTIVAWVQASNKTVSQACNGIDTEEPTLTFGSNPGGSITATVDDDPINSGETLNSGDEITFIATPAEGYEIKEWKLNGEISTKNISDEFSVTFEDSYVDVTVIFQTTHVEVNYSMVNNFGTLNATVDEDEIESGDLVIRNAEIVFTADPDTDYEIKEWKNNGAVIAGNTTNEYVIESINSNVYVTVEFQTTHVEVVYSIVNEFGTIYAVVEEDEIESGDIVERRSRVIFTAEPNAGYEVKEWKNNTIIVAGHSINEYIIESINSNVIVTVEFQTSHLEVNFSAINDFGGLSAKVNDDEIETGDFVPRRSRIVFTAEPEDGYEVKEWKNNENLVQGNTTNQYVIEVLNSEANVTVEFQQKGNINRQSLSDVTIYPNPFSAGFTVKNSDAVKTIEIFNIIGKQIMTVPNNEKSEIYVDTTNFEAGIYIITLQSISGDKIVQRLIKQ